MRERQTNQSIVILTHLVTLENALLIFRLDMISASSRKPRIFHPIDRNPLIKQQSFVYSNL